MTCLEHIKQKKLKIKREKKVFDILAVNVQTYLKKFECADNKTKKIYI